MSHAPYYVTLAGVTICEECSKTEAILWETAHPQSPATRRLTT